MILANFLNRLISFFLKNIGHDRGNTSGALAMITSKLEVVQCVALESDAIPLLVSLLHSSNFKVQDRAIWALHNILQYPPAASIEVNAEAILPLVHLLSSSNESVLLNVCEVLVSIVWQVELIQAVTLDASAISSLISLLHSHNFALVHKSMLQTLWLVMEFLLLQVPQLRHRMLSHCCFAFYHPTTAMSCFVCVEL
jgi:HEAT repeat protein